MPCHRTLAAAAAAVPVGGAAESRAHESGAAAPSPANELNYLECDHPPPDMVSALPPGMTAWMALDCIPVGQRFVAAKGWMWRFPGSFTDRPSAPAWAPDASMRYPGVKYFTAFEYETLEGAALEEAHRRLLKDSYSYAFHFESPPVALSRLHARNNLGHEMEIYLPAQSRDRVWAILCVPACRPEYAFVMERIQP